MSFNLAIYVSLELYTIVSFQQYNFFFVFFWCNCLCMLLIFVNLIKYLTRFVRLGVSMSKKDFFMCFKKHIFQVPVNNVE